MEENKTLAVEQEEILDLPAEPVEVEPTEDGGGEV